MRLSSDGYPFILPPALVAVTLAALGRYPASLVVMLVAICVALFFRDPARHCAAPPDRFVSPADGRVVQVRRTAEGGWLISIFLSVFNVHVARCPASGLLVASERIPGPLRAAFREDAAKNARVQMDIETPQGPVRLALMAGLVARRVLPWVQAPTQLRRGQRIAIIRFGSRAEIRLPERMQPTVKVGDRVRGGQTVIARPENRQVGYAP